MERKKKQINRLWPAVCALILLFVTGSCVQSYEERRWQSFRQQVIKDKNLPDSLKKEICTMSRDAFLKDNPLKKEIARQRALCKQEQEKGDSIWNMLIPLKESQCQAEREKHGGKTEILRIRRIWLNGDLLPWTYDSWLQISFRFNSRGTSSRSGRSMSFSGSITPDMEGYAKYIGENKLDYVNVVFSDKSYQRFLVKDHPEWLLAKEGDRVRVNRVVKNYKVGSDVGRVLEKDAYDLAISIEYVPLFK